MATENHLNHLAAEQKLNEIHAGAIQAGMARNALEKVNFHVQGAKFCINQMKQAEQSGQEWAHHEASTQLSKHFNTLVGTLSHVGEHNPHADELASQVDRLSADSGALDWHEK